MIEPDNGVIGIGSGGAFATAAANALLEVDGYDAEMIGRKVRVRVRVRVGVRPNPNPNPNPNRNRNRNPNPNPNPNPN